MDTSFRNRMLLAVVFSATLVAACSKDTDIDASQNHNYSTSVVCEGPAIDNPSCLAATAAPPDAVCAYGVCRRQCTSDSECEAVVPGSICLPSPNAGESGCRMPEEASCTPGSDECGPDLVCAQDGTCRAACPGGQCWLAGQACVDGVCVDNDVCTAPVSGPCDTIPQCGCPAGEACDVSDASGTTACFPTSGKRRGSPCSQAGDCEPGSTCIWGSCAEMCENAADCSIPGAECDADASTPGLSICTDQCDLVDPSNTCAPGMGCTQVDEAGTSACIGAGTSTSLCSFSWECLPGYTCVTNDSLCHKWCRVGESGGCPGGETCSESQTALVNGVEFGVCM